MSRSTRMQDTRAISMALHQRVTTEKRR